MSVLRESATNDRELTPDPADRPLICVPNWLGDLVMALPTINALGRAQPAARITMLCKPPLLPLWRLFNGSIEVIPLLDGLDGSWTTVRRLRAAQLSHAVILPNSFRSAWLPFVARIPVRRGLAGHQRRWLLTQTVPHPLSADGQPVHQCLEYAAVAGITLPANDAPLLAASDDLRLRVTGQWGRFLSGRVLMLFPGAARGPSKRWPATAFAELGRRWHHDRGGSIVIGGTIAEQGLCETVARAIGDAALNLAGKTALPELAALLALSSVVVANDSGGAHLAAALGTPVVVIFGMTDPAVTAPRGKAVRIVTAARPPAAASRRIPRDSATAQALLAAIPVAAVQAAIESAMTEPRFEETP